MKTCKNLSKRGLALFLALVMCLSMVQITAFAVDGHVHNEDGWSCTQDDSVRELSCDKHVHNDNCYQTVQGELTCEAEEHQHGDGCYEAAEPQLTCADAEHTHGDSCYTQGEDVLTCAETEHTHGEDCYAAETVKVCEEEDHQHGDECYTVTEGEWTCTAPVVEETSAEAQAFLDAAAELPDASEVTAENAEEIGEQVSAVLDLYEAVENETAEVTKALEAVYAVYEAVEAALELEDDTYYGTQYQPYYNAKITDVGSGKVVKGPTNTQARITAFVGEEWNFQRLPTQTYSGSICGHAMFVCAPKYYNLPSLKSYDDTIVQDDGYTIGTWNDKGLMPQMDGSDCLQWNFTALKPGKTTAQSHYYVRWDNYSNASGGCPICGWSTNGFDNRGVYYEYQDNIPITVNARYQLVYDLNGGTGSISPTTRDIADTTATLGTTSTIPTHPLGYTFKGWKDEADKMVDVSVTLNWSEGYGSKENPVTETLTAVWEENTTPPAPETIQVPVTIKVRFVGLDANTFNTKHDSGETATHPNEFYLTTPAHGADNESLGLSGQWNTLNSHGDGTESGTTYVPYVTFGPEGDYDNWAVETGKEYTAYFDLSNYTVDGYTYVSANGVANASSVKLKFQADNTNPQELVITLVYKKDIEPTTPDAPTHQDVRDLIGAPVTVVCDTENVSNNTFGYTGDKTDRVTIGKVEGDATSGYTCNVTFIAQKFCDAFSSVRKVAHELADSQGDVTLTFTWDAENNTWKLPVDFTAPVTIHVVCDEANIPYTLLYKANPGEEAEVENLPASETKYGTAPGAVDFIVSSQVPTRDGYSFAGWKVEDKLLHGGDAFTMKGSSAAVKVEQTLWATWTKNTDPGPGPGPGVEPDKGGIELVKKVNSKDVEDLTVDNRGGELTYTITVTNNTNVDLKDMLIRDKMPAGLKLVEGSGSVTVDGTPGTVTVTKSGGYHDWKVAGTVADKAVVVLTYKATVDTNDQVSAENIAKAFAKQNDPAGKAAVQGVAGTAAAFMMSRVSDVAAPKGSANFTTGSIDVPDGYEDQFQSNEDNAIVTAPTGGTNPGPVKPGKPDDSDLEELKLGVQVVCDVENSNHSVTEYLLKTAECTIGEVTENANTTTKEEYPYTCTVQLAASGQNWYLGQKIKDTQDYWNKEHQLADEEKILTATLYHDGEKWTLPIGGGMNPDVAQGTNIKAWKYLVIHTVHKAEQLPGAKDTTYTVVHEYYTNNSLTGTSQSVENGKVGQTVNAAEITKVTTYGGNSYTYTSANPEILVLADSENTITLRYDRTTGGNGGGNGGGTTRYTLTVRYEYEDGTQAAPTHTERLARGDAYSVDSPVIEGYTPDQAVVSGEMPGRSLTVTVVYTPEGQDIPDEEPPLVDLPDEEPPLVNIPEEEPPLVEIPEEEPPLAETPLDPTPKTGDNSRTGLWAALCGFSLFGMLALLGKKREDEEA